MPDLITTHGVGCECDDCVLPDLGLDRPRFGVCPVGGSFTVYDSKTDTMTTLNFGTREDTERAAELMEHGEHVENEVNEIVLGEIGTRGRREYLNECEPLYVHQNVEVRLDRHVREPQVVIFDGEDVISLDPSVIAEVASRL